MRAMNAMMLSSYHRQDWTSAFEALEELSIIADRIGLGESLDTYLFIMETRISEFRANPPGPNWNGVYEATSK